VSNPALKGHGFSLLRKIHSYWETGVSRSWIALSCRGAAAFVGSTAGILDTIKDSSAPRWSDKETSFSAASYNFGIHDNVSI
jgi:hypothetical protein